MDRGKVALSGGGQSCYCGLLDVCFVCMHVVVLCGSLHVLGRERSRIAGSDG